MKKLFDQINIKSVILFFLLIQPILDLITSIGVRYYPSTMTLGIIIKGLFLLLLIIYIFSKYKYKDRKISSLFIVTLVLYEIVYLIIVATTKTTTIIIPELKNSIKTLYGCFIAVTLFDIFKNEKFNIKSRYLSYVMIEYVLLILLATLTGTGFNTYLGGKQGTIGWFYAGNDISVTLISLFPILYFYSIKNFNWYFNIFLFISVYILLFIGTKVATFGLILSLIALLISSFANYFTWKNKIKFKKNLLLITLLIIFVCVILPFAPLSKNMQLQYDNNFKNKEEVKKSEVLDEMIYSGRTKYRTDSLLQFKEENIINKFFGRGYYDINGNEYKLVEIDCIDIFFTHGIIGSIIILSIYICIFIKILSFTIKNRFNDIFRMHSESYIISIFLFLGVASYAGHVFLNPAVSLYLAIVLNNIYYREKKKGEIKKTNGNKITIMALHLKHGGIENFIANTSKFLAKKHNVEIVSVYKYKKEEIVKIDKQVKIKYLLDEKNVPNKTQLREALKNKNMLSIIKELLISAKILLLKKYKMISYIKNCDSDIIISTRLEHNQILSEYADERTLKIATEHNYYSKKYSKKVANSCSDIDYFVVSTDSQKNYYENLFKGTNVKIVKICFGLDNNFTEQSSLNNYQLIAVGRLSREKGFDDLINIFKIIYEKNKKFSLKIIGSGDQEKNLKTQTKKLQLDKSIEFLGDRSSQFVKNEMLKSSMYLMTSLIESFGIVLIEAMSCGVPCIIFDDAKGALEIIKDDYNGYVISDRNYHDYANKIIELFENRAKLLKIGENCKLYSKKYNIKNVEIEWEKLLNK